ncbi:FtsW/RodA/SpoVE family cell cycle protein [Bacillus sp. SL00103]
MAIISEELGIMGMLIVMGAYLLIMYRAMRTVHALQDPLENC